MKTKKVNVSDLGRLPAFCHAVIAAELARGAAVEIDAVAYKPHAISDGITETQ